MAVSCLDRMGLVYQKLVGMTSEKFQVVFKRPDSVSLERI